MLRVTQYIPGLHAFCMRSGLISYRLLLILLSISLLASSLPSLSAQSNVPNILGVSVASTPAQACCCGTGACRMAKCPASQGAHGVGFTSCTVGRCCMPGTTPSSANLNSIDLFPPVEIGAVIQTSAPFWIAMIQPPLRHHYSAPPNQPPRVS